MGSTLRYASTRLQKGQNDFLEVGGGTGTFKRSFLEQAGKVRQEINYISLDFSPLMLKQQMPELGMNVRADALKRLPLADGSVNGIIFLNELFDALPFKVLRVKMSQDKEFLGFDELFFSAVNTLPMEDVSAIWKPPSKNVMDYWQGQMEFAKYIGFRPDWDFYPDDILTVNLNEEKLLAEVFRVMDKGTVLIFDYGYTIDRLRQGERKNAFKPRLFPGQYIATPDRMWQYAYEADITTDVNFTNLMLVAKRLGFKVEQYCLQQAFVVDQITPEEERAYEKQQEKHPWWPQGGLFNKGKKNFQALVLTKS